MNQPSNSNILFNIIGVVALILLFFQSLNLNAQLAKRQIRQYHVIVKTNKGTVRGILERCTSAKVYVSRKNGTYTAINASDVRIIKVKEYPRKRRVVEIPVLEPGASDYTKEGFLTKEYMDRAPSLAEEATYTAIGMAFTSIYGFFYNQFHNEKIFRPRYNIANYQLTVKELGLYAVYNQNASDYDILQLQGLNP